MAAEEKEQLDIAAKLNALLEQVAKTSSRIEKSYETQISLTEKLAQSIEKISTRGLRSKLEDVDNVPFNKIHRKLNDAGKLSKSFFSELKNVSSTLEKRFPVAVVTAASAISGFRQGVRNVLGVGRGMIDLLVSMASGMFNVGTAILSIPFKIFKGLLDLAAANANGMNELAVAVENLRKEFGALWGPTPHAVLETSKSLKNFSSTGLSTWRIFGLLHERIELMTKLAGAMGGTFTRLTKEFENNGGALLAYQKALGVSDDEMKGFAQRALATNEPVASVLKETGQYALDLAKAFNLDSKVISKDMSKAMSDVSHFAKASIKQIAEASTYARKLGVELEKIVGTLDAFETFDTAAENTAKLSQSFGVTVDAFKLMEMQDPASQLDVLRNAFISAGKSADNMSRQELKLLSQTTGLDEATAKMAFSAKNQGLTLDEVKKKSAETEKRTLTQAEALKKLADNIERLVRSGGGLVGSFFDMFIKGFFGGIQVSKEFRGTMFNIMRALQSVYWEGVRLGKMFVEKFPGAQKFFAGIAEFFQPQKFQQNARRVSDILISFFKDLSTGKASFPDAMQKIQDSFFTFFDSESSSGKKILNGFKEMSLSIVNILSGAMIWASDKIAEGMQSIADLIQNPGKLSKLIKSGSSGASFVTQLMIPIVKALQRAWTVLAPATFNLMKVLFKKVVHFLKTNEEVRQIMRNAATPIALAIFGPTFARAIFGALTAHAFKMAASGLSTGGLINRALSKLLGKAALGKLAGLAGGAGAIAMFAVGVGEGIQKYTDKITTSLDKSTKKIAAGATGVIDALTLGLLPEDFSVKIANVLAQLTDKIFDGISSMFGEGFGNSFKRLIEANLDVVGNLWLFVKSIFVGKQGDFNNASKELGLSLARFAMTAFETMQAQLPILIGKLAVKVISAAVTVLNKVVGAGLGVVASGLDKIFGTDYKTRVATYSEEMQKDLEKVADAAIGGLNTASSAVSNGSKQFQDAYLRSEKDRVKLITTSKKFTFDAEQKINKEEEQQQKQSLSTMTSNISDLKNLQKELDVEGFDVGKSLEAIRSKLANVKFEVIPEQKISQLETLTSSVQNLSSVSNSLKDLSSVKLNSAETSASMSHLLLTINNLQETNKSLTSIEDFNKLITAFSHADAALRVANELAETIQKNVSIIKKEGFSSTVIAVKKMVAAVNEIDEALNDSNLNKVDIGAKLGKVATSLGLGAKGQYTIQNKGVNVTINLNVTMDVGEVEKVVILRKQSIIRDRLNYLTSGTPGVSELPETTSGVVQPLANVPRTR